MPNGGIRNLNFIMFSWFFSDKIIVLEYAFIVFSKNIPIFWFIFIVYTSIIGLIQGVASIIELSFFIIFYIDKMATLKYQLKGCIHKILPLPGPKGINEICLMKVFYAGYERSQAILGPRVCVKKSLKKRKGSCTLTLIIIRRKKCVKEPLKNILGA